MEVLGFKKCGCCQRNEDKRYFSNLSVSDILAFY
jgi:hypothetical protein